MKLYLNPDLTTMDYKLIIDEFLTISKKEIDYIKIPTLNNKKRIEQLVKKVRSEKKIVFYDFQSLCLTLNEFRTLFNILHNNEIKIIFSNENDYMVEALVKIGEIEADIISKRVQNGIEIAKQNGKKIGRPKINQEITKKIKFLYEYNNKTIREIANECNVSIGSVYKYIHKNID